jgi:hypothetical protein
MPSLKEMHLDLELIFFAGGTSPVLAVVLHDGLAPQMGQLVKLAEIAAFAHKVQHQSTPEDYLGHAQALKHAVERHGRLIQAMSRQAVHAGPAAIMESARESLIRVSRGIEEARKVRAAAQQSSQGCEAT